VTRVKVEGLENVKITGEFIRLDALLKFGNAVESGGEAKTVIADGAVSVNGEVCAMRGKKLRHGDIARYNGRAFRVAARRASED
jgi:ribosome-associated protein